MDKMDELIGRALSAEDRELLSRYGEPGYLTQAFGMFRGPWNWVMWLVYLFSGVAFLGGIYAFWQVYHAREVLMALKLGVAGLVLFQMSIMGKSFLGTHMETNRILREVKRVELQISLLRSQS